MPPLRGLLASLGASVSLVAAGSLALLAISAFIGVGNLLGLGSDEESTLSIPEQGVVPRSEPGPPEVDAPVVLAAAPEDPAPAGGDTGGDVAPAAPAAGDADRPGAPSPTAPGPDTSRGGTTPPPPPPPDGNGGPASQVEADGPVRSLTGVTADVLRSTVSTVSPVTERLPGGALVEEVVVSLADTVESAGGALGSTLELAISGS